MWCCILQQRAILVGVAVLPRTGPSPAVMKTTQYWKPGETRPGGDGDGGSGSGRSTSERDGSGGGGGGRSTADEGSDGRSRGKSSDRQSNGSSRERSGSVGKRRKKKGGKDKDKETSTAAPVGIDAEISRAPSKPAVTGPSQGLLAMKFMQRKAKSDEAQKQQQARRDKLERDFSSSYAKRLKAADKANEKDRLVCRLDEQDPALVVIGRRSFGGFNAVAEAAYDACIKEIAAGERLGRQQQSGRDGGISDTEMAETLGKNVRQRGRSGRSGRR